MKKILLFLLITTISFAEPTIKYLGKVVAITSTKNPTTQYHIIYTTQQGVIGIIENVNLQKDVSINTSTYCIHGFLQVEEEGNLMNTKHYRITDTPPSEKWTYTTHQSEVTSLRYEMEKLIEENKNLKEELYRINSTEQ